jgi:hypothetical protein
MKYLRMTLGGWKLVREEIKQFDHIPVRPDSLTIRLYTRYNPIEEAVLVGSLGEIIVRIEVVHDGVPKVLAIHKNAHALTHDARPPHKKDAEGTQPSAIVSHLGRTQALIVLPPTNNIAEKPPVFK